MIRTFSALLLLGGSQVTLAAPVPANDAKAGVALYFRNLEKGFGGSEPLLAPPAKEVIAELGKYLATGTELQQGHAVSMIGYLGRVSKDQDTRALAVASLLSYATTEGKPSARTALEHLLRFSKDDFPPKAGAVIAKLVRVTDPETSVLLLAGLLDVRSVIDDLKPLAKTEDGQSPFLNNAWSANLALARLGEDASVKHCIAAIAAEKDIVQQARHFPELVYIRQEAATKVLTRYLMSEERLPSVRGDGPGAKLAQYALNTLAENIEGFPIKSEGGPSYTEEQLAAARKWVKEQKELKFKR